MVKARLGGNVWLKRGLVAGLALFGLYLGLGFWVAPLVIKSQLETRGSGLSGREVTLERARFNPLTLETRLYGLAVADGAVGELVSVERVAVNPQVWPLARKRLELKWVRVEGLRASVAIDAGGRFNFQDLLELGGGVEDAAVEAEAGGRFVVVAREVTLGDWGVGFADRSLAEAYEETLVLERFAGRDMGTLAKERAEGGAGGGFYHWDFDGALGTGSGGRIGLSGGATGMEPWAFAVALEVEGVDLASVNPYVGESVVAEIAGILGLSVELAVTLPDAGAPEMTAKGSLALEGFSARDAEREYVGFERFAVGGFELASPANALSIEGMYLDGLTVAATVAADGSVVAPQMKAGSGAAGEPGWAGQSFAVTVVDSGVRAWRCGICRWRSRSRER